MELLPVHQFQSLNFENDHVVEDLKVNLRGQSQGHNFTMKRNNKKQIFSPYFYKEKTYCNYHDSENRYQLRHIQFFAFYFDESQFC